MSLKLTPINFFQKWTVGIFRLKASVFFASLSIPDFLRQAKIENENCVVGRVDSDREVRRRNVLVNVAGLKQKTD